MRLSNSCWLRASTWLAAAWLSTACSLLPDIPLIDRGPVIALYRNEIDASNVGSRRGFGTFPARLIWRKSAFQVRQVLQREGYAVAEIEADDGAHGWAVLRSGELE
jgi:hypothetical protein